MCRFIGFCFTYLEIKKRTLDFFLLSRNNVGQQKSNKNQLTYVKTLRTQDYKISFIRLPNPLTKKSTNWVTRLGFSRE